MNSIRLPAPLQRLWRILWRVHPPVILTIGAPRALCLHTLVDAARPSQSRLHLRDLFASGRRYYLQSQADGFALRSDSAVPWNRRRRTRRMAVLEGRLSDVGAVTLVQLDARLRTAYLLAALLLPTWMASLLAYATWPLAFKLAVISVLYGCALASVWLEAALQAHAMIFFVRKALDDLPRGEVGQLAASVDEVVASPSAAAFPGEWERFVGEMRTGD
jgi:hypothetical protein